YQTLKTACSDKKGTISQSEINKLVTKNMGTLAQLTDHVTQLSFCNDGEIVLDTSYTQWRGIRGVIVRNVYNYAPSFSDDISNLEQFVSFVKDYYKNTRLAPEKAKQMNTNFEKAKQGLLQLKDYYVKMKYEPNSRQIKVIDKAIKRIDK